MTSSTRLITRSPAAAQSPQRSVVRFAPWVLACSLILVGAIAMLRRPAPPEAQSQVVRRIYATALHRSSYPGMDDGGPIGPWWITAAAADHVEGTLRQFRLTGGSMELTAREARVIVDPLTNDISFELHDVVFAVLPKDLKAAGGGVLTPIEYYVLGPVRWPRDIVPDAEIAVAPQLTMHE